ncbi:hypothetical protein NPIL_374791 [Nephila pilipes]|uniref:Uncharacterized protein n=1 Tax=Nephila pilipes TaxID=299642 RepID=A0A8X6TC32_NEPPI|nr:hypothetical protein NPIL_374791 [Nephila pilipes]
MSVPSSITRRVAKGYTLLSKTDDIHPSSLVRDIRRDRNEAKSFDINSTYNDETRIRRPVRALDSSKNENSRGVEPAPTPSPKRALWFQNPRVIRQSSSHEITHVFSTELFCSTEGASAFGCMSSSSGASAYCGNTQIGYALFRLRPRFTKFGIEQSVSTTSVAAFEMTIALLDQFNLEIDSG